jgi:hypothetical protein
MSVGTVISGRVVDSDGNPVTNASVSITSTGTSDAATKTLFMPDDGTYFASVMPGQTVVVSVAPASGGTYWYPGTADPSLAGKVVVCGQTMTVNITVPMP